MELVVSERGVSLFFFLDTWYLTPSKVVQLSRTSEYFHSPIVKTTSEFVVSPCAYFRNEEGFGARLHSQLLVGPLLEIKQNFRSRLRHQSHKQLRDDLPSSVLVFEMVICLKRQRLLSTLPLAACSFCQPHPPPKEPVRIPNEKRFVHLINSFFSSIPGYPSCVPQPDTYRVAIHSEHGNQRWNRWSRTPLLWARCGVPGVLLEWLISRD